MVGKGKASRCINKDEGYDVPIPLGGYLGITSKRKWGDNLNLKKRVSF